MVNFLESQPSSEMNKPFIMFLMVGFHNEPLYRYHHYLCLDVVVHAFPSGRWSLTLSVTSPPMLPSISACSPPTGRPPALSGEIVRCCMILGLRISAETSWFGFLVCMLFFGNDLPFKWHDSNRLLLFLQFDAIGPFANVGLLTIIDLTIEHNSPSKTFMINNHPYVLDYFSYMYNYPHPSLLTISNHR